MGLKLFQVWEQLIKIDYTKLDDVSIISRDAMTSQNFDGFGATLCNLTGWKIRIGKNPLYIWKNRSKSTRNWKQNLKIPFRSLVIAVFVPKSAIFVKIRAKMSKKRNTHNFWTN